MPESGNGGHRERAGTSRTAGIRNDANGAGHHLGCDARLSAARAPVRANPISGARCAPRQRGGTGARAAVAISLSTGCDGDGHGASARSTLPFANGKAAAKLPELSLDQHAQLSAELAIGAAGAKREELLRRYGIDGPDMLTRLGVEWQLRMTADSSLAKPMARSLRPAPRRAPGVPTAPVAGKTAV